MVESRNGGRTILRRVMEQPQRRYLSSFHSPTRNMLKVLCRWPKLVLCIHRKYQGMILLRASTVTFHYLVGTKMTTQRESSNSCLSVSTDASRREEHRKREERSGKPCPFFHAKVQIGPSGSKGAASRKSKAAPRQNEAATEDSEVEKLAPAPAKKGKQKSTVNGSMREPTCTLFYLL